MTEPKDLTWHPNNCPHLWEDVSTLAGKKHTICILCGVNKITLEYVSPHRKKVRLARPTQRQVTLKLSDRSQENLRQAAKARGLTKSDIVEKFLFSLTPKHTAVTSGQLAREVYVVEKLIFTEWEPFACSCSREEALHILDTCGAEGRLNVFEYVPKKFLTRLVEAVEAALKGDVTPKKMGTLRGACGQAKGLLRKKAD